MYVMLARFDQNCLKLQFLRNRQQRWYSIKFQMTHFTVIRNWTDNILVFEQTSTWCLVVQVWQVCVAGRVMVVNSGTLSPAPRCCWTNIPHSQSFIILVKYSWKIIKDLSLKSRCHQSSGLSSPTILTPKTYHPTPTPAPDTNWRWHQIEDPARLIPGWGSVSFVAWQWDMTVCPPGFLTVPYHPIPATAPTHTTDATVKRKRKRLIFVRLLSKFLIFLFSNICRAHYFW